MARTTCSHARAGRVGTRLRLAGGTSAHAPDTGAATTKHVKSDDPRVSRGLSPRSRACGTAVFVLLRTKCARWILKVALIGPGCSSPRFGRLRISSELLSEAGVESALVDVILCATP